jgi:hypothetical protein
MKDDFLDRCDELLKKLEWSGTYSYCTGWPCCPICKGIKPGHGLDRFGNEPLNIGHSKECSYYGLFEDENQK